MKLYNFEELLEDDFGPVGTSERNRFEREVDEAVSKSCQKNKDPDAPHE